jgi:adenine-specific DNA-methyltransferase
LARLDDLVARVPEPALRRELEAALADTKRRQRFGLVFEEHIPEMSALIGLPVQTGSLVQRRDEPAGTLYRVDEVSPEGDAVVMPTDGGEPTMIPVDALLAVKRFGEPIYPALTPLGSVRRGANDKPHHAVINGENFHALQLLVYQFEGQVDCIYLDPPYNTGAKDWKYNNRYVDDTDVWRHSKWLSMMEKRLRLARRLLKPDGVLIVTIDEHEVHHLGMLLEKLYPEVYRQMVTIVINPKGVTQGRFSRVEEYAIFVFMPGATVTGRGDDLLTPGIEKEDEEPLNVDEQQRPRWKGLLRSGSDARRQDREDMFYPVLIDPERQAVVGTGEPLPLEQEPDFDSKIDGFACAWPVRRDESLGRWAVGPTTLRSLIEKGYVAVGGYDPKRKTWAISYLSKEPREQIDAGILEVLSYDEDRNVVDVVYTDVAKRRLKSVWHRTRHDAGVGGSDVLQAIFGSRVFPFPKSVYAVADCLSAVLRDRPNALVVDAFAGSGTTLHATCLLNAEDGGDRRCILVTNNEVEDATAKELNKDGFYRGSPKYEAQGIFERVARPRCEAVVRGKRPDGTPVPGTHFGGRPFAEGFPENVEFYRLDYLDPDEVDLGLQFEAILPTLWMIAGGVGEREKPEKGQAFSTPEGSTYGVLFRESRFAHFREALEERPEVTHVWLVTDSEEAYAEMVSALPRRLKVSMLYRDYLRNFKINTERNL